LLKHYSPRAKLQIMTWRDAVDLEAQVRNAKFSEARTHIISYANIPSAGAFGSVSVIPHDAEAFARAIYAELHRCDEAGAEWIIVEALPDTNEWQAITDRLKRAAT
jgi:L-threonylcarbamoyladenylate synthase